MGAQGRLTEAFVAVRVPDWSVAVAMRAAEVGPERPAAVHDGHQVTSVSAVARALGVQVGMRRRAAQEACPQIELLGLDQDADARAFDAVVAVVEQVVARVTVVRPGLVWAPLPGYVAPVGEPVETLASTLTDAVAAGTGDECVVGVAGSPFAAVVATGHGLVVPPGRTEEYLRRQPVGVLRQMAAGPAGAGSRTGVTTGRRTRVRRPQGLQVDEAQVVRLVDLLVRLGVQDLGALLGLEARTLHSRFGSIGLWAHRMASGGQERAVEVWTPQEPLAVSVPIDPPALRSDAVTFLAQPLAESLQTLLRERSLTCARLRVTAVTEEGGELTRLWQADDTAWGATTARHVVDRVRWQLDGWLTRGAGATASSRGTTGGDDDPPVAPVVRLEVAAEEVSPAPLQQETLWGGGHGGDRRARRVIDRVQGLLGVGEVFAAVPQGGRTPADQVRLVPWGQPTDHVRPLDRPWPGSLPAPSPATVLATSVPAEVLDGAGRRVEVGERLGLSGAPARVRLRERGTYEVTGWAGPWPVVERWWAPDGRRVAYVQVLTPEGLGLLLGYQQGAWTCEALYD